MLSKKFTIKSWLLEDGFEVEEVSDRESVFNLSVRDRQGRTVNIFQHMTDPNKLTIATRLALSAQHINGLRELSKRNHERWTDAIWDLRLELLRFELGHEPSVSNEGDLSELRLESSIYYDELQRGLLMRKLLLIRSTMVWIFSRIEQALGTPPLVPIQFRASE